jgi:hypothetical protein
METTDDDDLQLLKASAGLVDGVNSLLARLLWKTPSRDTKQIRVHRIAKEKELNQLILKVRRKYQEMNTRSYCTDG